MKIKTSVISVIVLPFVFSIVSLAQLPDPKKILMKTELALSNIKSISYRAEHYTIGTLKYGDADAILTPICGEVLFVPSDSADLFGGMFCVHAERMKTNSENKSIFFEVAYDGIKIRKIEPDKKIVYVNDPDQNGMALTVGAFDLIISNFFNKDILQKILNAEKIVYEGVAVIGGISCHIIHVFYSGESPYKESWWFIGLDDFLPRKIQNKGYGLPNQEITKIFTFSDLKINIPIESSMFTIDAPEDFSVEVYQRRSGSNLPALPIGSDAPTWNLQDQNGVSFALENYRHKILILDFWATWCGPCRMAIPYLQKLHERFKDKGVVVIGVNTWESGDPVKFMQEKGFTYQILLNGDEVAKNYGINGIPTLYVIGPDGKILYGEIGFRSENFSKLVEIIEKHIDE